MIDTNLVVKRNKDILKNILTRLETSNLSLKEDDSISTNEMLDEFPIKDSEMLQIIDHRLKTDESYKNLVVRSLKKGTNYDKLTSDT